MPAQRITMDANEAVASVAYRLNEVIAIYPITPATPMGEHADEWAAAGKTNLWGVVPSVAEMQSEGGAAGAVHGALQAGALATTFTASQGLLLMIPNLYKIAGELTPFCLHVAARSLATHALSIFCDHSDVMACRQTGFALFCSSSVQQAHDFACVSHATTLRSRIPFLHFFDGFRTSHELLDIEVLSDDQLRQMIDEDLIAQHRARALTPDHPVLRGTAQNPDAFFQAREASNPYYAALPSTVEQELERFAKVSGRRYKLFDYHGHPEAERVIVVMGSASLTVQQTARYLAERGERVGVVTVHLYRPFSTSHLLAALPQTVRRIAVLDRTKEPGATGEPLFLDVVAALASSDRAGIRCIGGRYGLGSKEFTPRMVRDVYAELDAPEPRRQFTVGIIDDVSFASLKEGPPLKVLDSNVYEALFFGLGSDGTVSANKNTAKIVAGETPLHVQGYFVYDSKKSGAMTVSHVRFASEPISAPYLIDAADFIACHQFELLESQDVLGRAKHGATVLLNAPQTGPELWRLLPEHVCEQIRDKQLRVFAVDAYAVAREAGLGRRINTVMQTCFFAVAKLMPVDVAIAEIEASIAKTYGKKGAKLVEQNQRAVQASLSGLHELPIPTDMPRGRPRRLPISDDAPDFVRRVTAELIAGRGDYLPVSAFPVDGTWPVATSLYEKRRLATEVPVWDAALCIQCNKCTLICPHAALRAKIYDHALLDGAPGGYKSTTWKGTPLKGEKYTIQVAPEDCTGCHLCVEICPAKDKKNPDHKALDMQPVAPLMDAERENFAFFSALPDVDRTLVNADVKGSQLLRPLFEYSGACTGCGETPYIKLLTQLFGDRVLMANATGCSSIFGGNLPTAPYAKDQNGRGPAWANSLFEDNAEFGFGMRLSVDLHTAHAQHLLSVLAAQLPERLVDALNSAPQGTEAEIAAQRARVLELRAELAKIAGDDARRLEAIADYLVRKSVWLVGGDGWAYDIGYGGLDHVLASDRNVNVLVLDTEVYSNTGGQRSKSTPLGATAKFAALGKELPKKDLGLLAMTYGHVYVARVALGAKDAHALRAFQEADAYPGPSLILAYSHCIAHDYAMEQALEQQKLATESGIWPLYRFDPRRAQAGQPPLLLDSGEPKASVREYLQNEGRFRKVTSDPSRRDAFFAQMEQAVSRRMALYQQLSKMVELSPTAIAATAAAEEE